MNVLKVRLAVLRYAQIKTVATRVLVALAIDWGLMNMDVKVNMAISYLPLMRRGMAQNQSGLTVNPQMLS